MDDASVKDPRVSALQLLCPRCRKLLPLSGSVCMEGTAGIFCRHCRRIIQLSLAVTPDTEEQDKQ